MLCGLATRRLMRAVVLARLWRGVKTPKTPISQRDPGRRSMIAQREPESETRILKNSKEADHGTRTW